MLNLEDFMNIRDWKQKGWGVSAIADELHLDRKTVRKHLLDAPQPYKRENPAPGKIDPYRPFLRERWEKGVHNARKLLDEIRGRGYDGGYSQLKLAVRPWREEGRERAFVRFETGPGEQSQMDWGHFGNWGGRRLYGFALTLCYSRMRYIEFTQSQDIHHLLSCMVHGFRYFGGVTETVLTDRMKNRAARSKRRRVALQPEVSAVRRLLRLGASRLPPLPAGNQRQDRVDRTFRQAELLAGDLLPLAG